MHFAIEKRAERACLEKTGVYSIQELCSATKDHGYNSPAPETTALRYLAGYVAFKLSKNTHCENCMKEAIESQDSLPPEAVLIIERAFVTGSVVFISNKQFTCIRFVEHTVRQVCKGETFGDLFWDALDTLIKKGTNIVGCPEHAEKFTAELIHFYLVCTFVHNLSAKRMTVQFVHKGNERMRNLFR